MSEKPKKMNRYITKYEQIYQKLAKVTNIYLQMENDNNYERFILNERKMNQTHLTNSLIELPNKNIKNIIKQQYISEPVNTGELGTIEPEEQAYEIRNIALLILMSNRLSKEYKHRIERNEGLDENTKAKYKKNERDLLTWKDGATSDLMASLYVLEKTGGEEYENLFSYGDRKDDENKSTFVIDLPYIGQIGIHFGREKMNDIEVAKNKAISILERKRELGQISEEKLEELKQELSADTILPKYEGKLYEYTSGLPIEYTGPHTKEKIKELGLDTKLPEEIGTEDIQKIYKSGLNEREAYYLAIKLGFPKAQLKEIIRAYNEKENLTDIGKKAVEMTTAEERANVLQFENRNIYIYKTNINENAIGG